MWIIISINWFGVARDKHECKFSQIKMVCCMISLFQFLIAGKYHKLLGCALKFAAFKLKFFNHFCCLPAILFFINIHSARKQRICELFQSHSWLPHQAALRRSACTALANREQTFHFLNILRLWEIESNWSAGWKHVVCVFYDVFIAQNFFQVWMFPAENLIFKDIYQWRVTFLHKSAKLHILNEFTVIWSVF